MAGTLPQYPGPRTAPIKGMRTQSITPTVTGGRQVIDSGNQWWSIEYVYAGMKEDMFAPIGAFIESNRGGLDNFQVIVPKASFTDGLQAHNLAVTGAVNGGPSLRGTNRKNQVNVTSTAGLTISGALKRMDFFKFAGHSKVYMVTEDLDLASGLGTLKFEPDLVAETDPAINSLITYDAVPFTVWNEDGVTHEWVYSYDKLVRGYKIMMKEVV